MKKRHIVLYHSVYWMYRVVNILTFNHFLFGEDWYRGAYVVQLVLMPFFYLNYGLLIPSLIKKNYYKFTRYSIVWIIGFVVVYSWWTAYQRHILYGEPVSSPDYIETLNNLVYIWLISASFCLFEYWIKNLKRNRQLALDRKKHLLKSEENKMLNHLLSDYLDTLNRIAPDLLPDKIIMVADFFKYILYYRERPVPFKTELKYLRIFEEIKNLNVEKVRIFYGYTKDEVNVYPTRVIAVINRLAEILYKGKSVDVTVEMGESDDVLLYLTLPGKRAMNILKEEFSDLRFDSEGSGGRLIISIDRQYNHTPVIDFS